MALNSGDWGVITLNVTLCRVITSVRQRALLAVHELPISSDHSWEMGRVRLCCGDCVRLYCGDCVRLCCGNCVRLCCGDSVCPCCGDCVYLCCGYCVCLCCEDCVRLC